MNVLILKQKSIIKKYKYTILDKLSEKLLEQNRVEYDC